MKKLILGVVLFLAVALVGCGDRATSSRYSDVAVGECARVYLSESGVQVEGLVTRITYNNKVFLTAADGSQIAVSMHRRFTDAAGSVPCEAIGITR